MWARTAGIHPQVTVVGILRNVSRRAFDSYRYRFDIIRFEDIQKKMPEQSFGDEVTTVDFCELAKNPRRYSTERCESTLDAGKTYRAVVRGDKELDLVLVPPLRMFSHWAVSIEWTNLREFPELEKLRDSSTQQLIVFSVISDENKQMTAQRWNRTVKCKIIRVE